MWLQVTIPNFGTPRALVRLERQYAAEGEQLRRGDSLLDLIVDLSAGVVRDCPPISTCRIFLREPAWLRRIEVVQGIPIPTGACLALLSTEPGSEPAVPQREARVSVATMLHHNDWWTYGT
jgi:hypothetical protein